MGDLWFKDNVLSLDDHLLNTHHCSEMSFVFSVDSVSIDSRSALLIYLGLIFEESFEFAFLARAFKI